MTAPVPGGAKARREGHHRDAGHHAQRLAANKALKVFFWLNGKIAFTSTRDGNSEIYVMNADGSGQVRLTNNTIYDHYPAWSPDGKKIAFTKSENGTSSVFIMNADGSGQMEIAPGMSGTSRGWNATT